MSFGQYKIQGTTAQNLGYDVISLNVTQTSTNAPTGTVFTNTTGASLSFGYDFAGTYYMTADAEIFTNNKTQVFINSNPSFETRAVAYRGNTTVIYIESYNASNTPTNNILDRTPIEIRIYP